MQPNVNNTPLQNINRLREIEERIEQIKDDPKFPRTTVPMGIEEGLLCKELADLQNEKEFIYASSALPLDHFAQFSDPYTWAAEFAARFPVSLEVVQHWFVMMMKSAHKAGEARGRLDNHEAATIQGRLNVALYALETLQAMFAHGHARSSKLIRDVNDEGRDPETALAFLNRIVVEVLEK
jgi:hypothetical protein